MAFTRVLGPGIHTASNINSHNINSTGIITAVSFVGDGSGLTGVASTDNIITGTAATFNTYPVDINAGMDVVGVSSFQDIDVDGHTFLDNVSIAGVTSISQDLDVDGHTFLDNVSIAGVTTFSGAITGTSANLSGNITANRFTGTDGNAITLGDSKRIVLGTGSDFELFHNGTNSYIDNNTGDLYLQTTGSGDDIFIESADDFFIKVNGSDIAMQAYGGAFVELRNNNEVKFRTTTEGIEVLDTSNNAATVKMNTSVGYAGALYAVNNSVIALTAGNYNYVIKGNSGGSTELYHTGNAKKLETTTTGITVTGNVVSTGADINGDLDVDGHTNLDNVSIAGVTTFSGGISGSTANLTGALTGTTANFSGNVTVGGVLTYEDVKNVDSIGIATARAGLKVLAGGVEIDGGGLDVVGVSTFNDDVTLTGVSGGTSGSAIWDKSDKSLIIGNNAYLKLGSTSFGSGQQLQIYQSGSSGFAIFRSLNNNRIAYHNDKLYFNNQANNIALARIESDEGVSLYYTGTKRLQTSGIGVTVTGTVVATGADINGDLDVDGHTNLDNVNIVGVTTVAGDILPATTATYNLGTNNAGGIGNGRFNNAYFKSSVWILDSAAGLILGDSMDTKIYHDGNSTKIDHSGPGGLTLRSNNGFGFSCSTSAGETAMQIIKDGGVKLYHNQSGTTSSILRFETTNQGINVIGHSELDNVNISGVTTTAGNVDINADLDVDGHTELDNVNVVGVVTASAGFRVPDGNYNTNLISVGSQEDFIIYHDTAHTYAENKVGDFRLKADTIKIQSRTGVENFIQAAYNGAVEVYYDGSKKLETSDKGIKVGTGVTIETNGQATYTGIITATAFKLADGSAIGAGAGGTWSTYTAGIATSKSVGVNTSNLDDNDLVGVGNSFQGLYISNGMIIHDNTLNGNHYIGTAFNGLMAGPVNIEGTLSVDGSYVVV